LDNDGLRMPDARRKYGTMAGNTATSGNLCAFLDAFQGQEFSHSQDAP